MSTQVLHLKQYSDLTTIGTRLPISVKNWSYDVEVLSTKCTVIIANNVIVVFRVTCENTIKACVCMQCSRVAKSMKGHIYWWILLAIAQIYRGSKGNMRTYEIIFVCSLLLIGPVS